jgi:hypothetical protein
MSRVYEWFTLLGQAAAPHHQTSRTARSQELHVSLDDTTMTLGPFRVDAAGTLEPIESGPAPGFTCSWRNRKVHAKLLPGEPSDWRLQLQAPLGRVPSSARTSDAARRLPGFALLRELPATLPKGWRIGLGPDHRVLLEAECRAALPITATALIAEVTSFLLELAPYLDVLDEAGLTAPADPAGTANT